MALLCSLWTAGREAQAFRPFDSTDADVAKPLEFELEMGPIGYLALGSTKSLIVPDLVLNLGFAPGWELVLQGEQFIQLGPIEPQQPRYSLVESAILVKVMLRDGSLQDKTGPSVAVEGGVLLPGINGERGFGASVDFIVSQRFTAVTLSVDATFLLTHGGNFGVEGGVILEGPYRWVVRPVGEVLVAYETTPGTVANEATVGSLFSLLVGAIWTVSPNFAVDFALRAGSDSGQLVEEVRAGFTWSVDL